MRTQFDCNRAWREGLFIPPRGIIPQVDAQHQQSPPIRQFAEGD
jgi:hypothetical protein